MFSAEKILPGALFLALAATAFLLNFNGLYGQDAHEYFRQAQVFFTRISGGEIPSATIGDASFGAGYPFFGGLLTFITGNAMLSLQLISWSSGALAVYFFLSGCRYLLPGAKTKSRFLFGVFFLSAPVFLRGSFTSMSDVPALAMTLGALRFGLDAGEHRNGRALLLAACAGGLAILIRPAMFAVLAPLMIWVSWRTIRRQFLWWLGGILILVVFAAVHIWAKMPVPGGMSAGVMHDWSAFNFFRRTFTNASGTVTYFLPNILQLFSPLAHYGFFVATFLLFFLFKKTDLHLPVKLVLVAGMLTYMLLIGGLPVPNVRYLLPVWAISLWLLYPAWDRFYAYGLYFFPKLTKGLLLAGITFQLAGLAWNIRPVIQLNHFEQHLATHLRSQIPPDAALYTMDVDIALKSYLTEIQYFNIWETTYDSIPAGSYFLYNENKLNKQWAGMNPVKNWENLRHNHQITAVDTLGEGWTLYLAMSYKR